MECVCTACVCRAVNTGPLHLEVGELLLDRVHVGAHGGHGVQLALQDVHPVKHTLLCTASTIITLLSHHITPYHTITPPLSYWYHSFITPLSHHYQTLIPPLSHYNLTLIPTTITTLSHLYHNIITPLSHHYHTVITTLSHIYNTFIPLYQPEGTTLGALTDHTSPRII